MEIHNGPDKLNIGVPVVTIGSFDGVHLGHRKVLDGLKACARRLGGESVVMTFDPHPREVLYPLEKRPGILTTLPEKAEMLAVCGVEHLVVLPFTSELAALSYEDFVRDVLVDRMGIKGLVVGYDHRFGKDRQGDFQALQLLAGKYDFYIEQEEVYVAREVNVSSTKIRTALELGDVTSVKEFLGYHYRISGQVVHGEKIGRSIGFPTANISIDDSRKLLPATGVYAVRVDVPGAACYGMLNIGVRPTVSNTGVIRLEVNIFGFQGDIYDEPITVHLLQRIRGERKFDNPRELALQLAKDREMVMRLI